MKLQISLAPAFSLDLDSNPPTPPNVLRVPFAPWEEHRAKTASQSLTSRDKSSEWETIAYAVIELGALGGIALAAVNALSS